MKSNIPVALRQLSAILRKIEELQEWAKLQRQERKPHQPPSFRLDNHIEEDLKIEYSAFISIALDISDALNNPSLGIPEAKRRRWINRLNQLEDSLRAIDICEKLKRSY